MSFHKSLFAVAFITLLSPLAQATKCGQVVYNKHGMLRKYEVLPLDLSESWKKHGISSTSGATTESSTASSDPGVSTGGSDSQTQSTFTKGDCKWWGIFSQLSNRDYQNYVEQNFNEINSQIAVGQGGHIEMLSLIVDCAPTANLGQSLQKNMSQFVDLTENDSQVFLERVRGVINTNSQLSKLCQARSVANK
jgi:hypothetical protein